MNPLMKFRNEEYKVPSSFSHKVIRENVTLSTPPFNQTKMMVYQRKASMNFVPNLSSGILRLSQIVTITFIKTGR